MTGLAGVKEPEIKTADSPPTVKHVEDTSVASPTTRITRADLKAILNHYQLPFGLRMGAASVYTPMPVQLDRRKDPAEGIVWRVELHGLGQSVPPVGYDIIGDVAMGRGDDDIDLNLEIYGATQQGVSRRHALLRPTRNCLYLLDLSSTNGTLYNGMRMNSGIVHAINDGDTITLGRFSFQVRIIDWPALHQTH